MAIFFVDALVKRASDQKAVNFALLIKRILELNRTAEIIVDRLAKPNADDIDLAEQKAALRAMDSALAILNAFINKKKNHP